jgi:hypothetical protein
MKKLKRSGFCLLMIVFSGVFLNSCNKKNAPLGPDYHYFLADEHKFDITIQQAKNNLLAFQVIIPQSSLLGAVVQSDVQVEKVTYKTTFLNQNIQASIRFCLFRTGPIPSIA